ncbi:MAG: hypothetical protein JWP50_1576 [Phenylobacterium sp.]|nr:hypothetical protein [Phenylobacterium sp.]
MPTIGRRAPARARKSTPESRLRRKAQRLSGKALDTLAKLMEAEKTPPPIRLAAAREVLDRGHGRPKLGPGEAGEGGGMTVIVKRYSDVTDEEKARAEEGEP